MLTSSSNKQDSACFWLCWSHYVYCGTQCYVCYVALGLITIAVVTVVALRMMTWMMNTFVGTGNEICRVSKCDLLFIPVWLPCLLWYESWEEFSICEQKRPCWFCAVSVSSCTFFVFSLGDTSCTLFHTFPTVLWTSSLHTVEVCPTWKAYSILLSPTNWGCMLQGSVTA